MKRRIVILLVSLTLLNANEFKYLVKRLDKNSLIKSKEYKTKAYYKKYLSTKGAKLPKVDLTFRYIRLFETPKIALNLPPFPKKWVETGSKNIYEVEVSVSYPIFRGFAISNLIKQSKLQMQIASLKTKDLKRNLKLKLAILYGNLYALKALKVALIEAKNAYNISLKKIKAYYKMQIIPKSEVLNLKANLYKSIADIHDVDSNIKIVNNEIKFLTSRYAKAKKLPFIKLKKQKLNRADILVLKKSLLIDKANINLAKSKLYPEINLKIAYKKFGDSLALNGDGYKNSNQGYGAIEIKQNLFNGFSDKNSIESAKASYIAKIVYINNYIKNIKKDIKNERLKLNSLYSSLKWAKEQYKASKEYLKLTKIQFKEQLVSSDELSSSIAFVANSIATIADIKSKIFIQKVKINLLQSDNIF